jgi:hypothetical protein
MADNNDLDSVGRFSDRAFVRSDSEGSEENTVVSSGGNSLHIVQASPQGPLRHPGAV